MQGGSSRPTPSSEGVALLPHALRGRLRHDRRVERRAVRPQDRHERLAQRVLAHGRRLGRGSLDRGRLRSQQAVEAERTNLAVILARLSTGVISLEPDRTLRTVNQAAVAILGADIEACIGRPLAKAGAGSALFEQFEAACSAHLDAGQTEWREQLVLQGESTRRVLMCACTTLSGRSANRAQLPLGSRVSST